MTIRQILVFLALSLLLEAGECWKIKDRDQKSLCESKYENKKSCWKIKDNDMKAYCESSAYGKRNCWKIKDRDYKEMCKAETGQ